MVIMKRIKSDSLICKIPRKTDSLELSIKCPLCYSIVCKGIKYVRRNLLAADKVYDLYLSTVNAVSEKQYFKIVRLGIFIYTAFLKTYGRICFDINL